MFRLLLTTVVTTVLTLTQGVLVLTICFLLPARRAFNPLFWFWCRMILAAAGVRLIREQAEPLDPERGYFLVGNHESLIDIPVMGVVMGGNLRFLAKESLFRIPWFGWVLHASGFVPVHRGNTRKTKQAIDAMLERLKKRGGSMLVFPEGSRSPDGRLRAFRPGSLQVCQRSGMSVVPFAIVGSRQVHQRGQWRIRAGEVRVMLGRPIPPAAVAAESSQELAARIHAEVARMMGPNRPSPDDFRSPAMAAPCGGAS